MSKKQPKLTPWFPGDVKPVRTGFYERLWSCNPEWQKKYQPDYWSGSAWYYGGGSNNHPEKARAQDRMWRGLAVKP